MVWTDSIYANNESPPINKKEKRKRIKNNQLAIYTKRVARWGSYLGGFTKWAVTQDLKFRCRVDF